MHFLRTGLPGVFIIEPERKEDERGFFARVFCEEEFGAYGLETNLVQCSISFNKQRGTLRGMHYQAAPYEEVRLVRCTMGAVYDVVLDLQPDSPTLKQWIAAELTSENRRMVYVPKGFAHGFLTLENSCEVFYQMSEFYHHENAGGVRWDDPAFGIQWPAPVQLISERDRSFKDFSI
ncbi:MAG: dTDP-4-dehydrorhamnose 3,5-epimerase [Anaerolineaceae bacterium]|jgi:dTDP-4-dehydrorhamnose 3,5-epimerase